MSYTNGLDKPSDYFNTVLYTGNGSTQSITGVNFQPDFVWLKHRDNPTAYSHQLYDAVRGAGNYLLSNTNAAENDGGSAPTDALTSFDSDGFSLGANAGINQNTINHVSWNWLANGAGSSNTDGSITSTVSANTTSGFSIVSYTGNGTAGATIGHGLNAVPSMVIVKRLDGIANWVCYHSGIGATKYIELNTTTAAQLQSSYNMFNSTAPSSSLVTLGDIANTNGNTNTYIAYCFAEKKGFSKFGSYTGNGSSTDGTFVYTGFKPAWVLLKNTTTGGLSWNMYDNKRLGYNVDNNALYANLTATEVTDDDIDFVSNGFKLRRGANNQSGENIIYMAFAEFPIVSSTGTPVTAR